ncbi:MAG: cyclopropane-fatty-acyl-phospholipid synthase family protein [Geoalkalibacter sp.]|uniref:SAM-dependent methyltransferase n=1 Tax=Geoalkalibacter sp. TaxID=3041440 RepID=UPI003D13C5DC
MNKYPVRCFRERALPILRGVKNAFFLFCKRDWQGFITRLRIAVGQVDLRLSSLEDVGLPEERAHYYADSGGIALEKILRQLGISSGDAIVDFGCGKGGALISFARYPFAKITGVELSPELSAIARENLKKLGIDKVAVECCDASDFKELHDFNYFYFFDPFPCPVLKEVLGNIEDSIDQHPRKVTLIYLNPHCHAEVESSSVFCKVKELKHFEHQCYVYENALD